MNELTIIDINILSHLVHKELDKYSEHNDQYTFDLKLLNRKLEEMKIIKGGYEKCLR